MGSLPIYKSSDTNYMLQQNSWARTLNPIIANPITNPTILENINLIAGKNVINHLLGVTMQGWWIIDQQAAASIYRSAPFNDKTLTLTSSAQVTISLAVF